MANDEEEVGGIGGNGITPVQQMISSCSGAIVTSLFVTPLDVVKIRLQAQETNLTQRACFIYSNGLMDHICAINCAICGGSTGKPVPATTPKAWYARPGRFTGTFSIERQGARAVRTWQSRYPLYFNGTLDTFVKITRYEGIRSLWSGLPPTLVMAVPATVVYFSIYDQLKYQMGYREGSPNTRHIPMMAGATARVFAATLISPLELIRTKMQSQQFSYREVGQAVRGAIDQGGLLSLMRGLGPTLLRDVPFSAIYWFGYEYVKAVELQHSHQKQVSFVQSFIAGATAGTIAAIVTLPFDVVKTHRQIALGEELFQGRHHTSSTWKIASRLYQERGVSSLFSGLVPRLIKVAPACAIMISSYEFGKSFFRAHNVTKAREKATLEHERAKSKHTDAVINNEPGNQNSVTENITRT